MPTPSFTNTEAAATSSDIAAIEKEYGFELPADYKAHILAVNGGNPNPDSFVVTNSEKELNTYSVNTFYSIKYGDDDALEMALEDLYDELHPDLVPFADEAGGDQFCLSVGPEDYGSVYYISHEAYQPPKRKERKQPRQYGKGVSFLAPSFTAFLDGLVEVAEEPGEE